MKLTRIQATGLKGSPSIDVALPAVLYLHGRNGTGKSEIADAIELLIEGKHHAVDATSDGTMRLASGDDLDVTGYVTADEGTEWILGRSWTRTTAKRGKRKGDVKISKTIHAGTAGGVKLVKAEAEAKIAELLGTADILDIGRLLGKTSTQRRDMLFRLGASQAGWTIERVLEEARTAEIQLINPRPKPNRGLYDWLSAEHAAARARSKTARAKEASTREALDL